ncbi:MAG: histidine phosphatase family protein [Clostridia bacterium]|jgi:alpha-ribazole phosphatase|nr:histidine phosphatase family protein [Clostridia bacterium]
MEVILLRHAQTAGNLKGCYIGRTDEPLSETGIGDLQKKGVFNKVAHVFVSPMRRAVETANLLFPKAEFTVCEGLREMDFGVFEGRSPKEMKNDDNYRTWVDGGCIECCPNGESVDTFTERTCAAFDEAVRKTIEHKEKSLIVVAHGGSIMSIMSCYAKPHRPYFEWHVQNCGGYRAVLDENTWASNPILRDYAELGVLCL